MAIVRSDLSIRFLHVLLVLAHLALARSLMIPHSTGLTHVKADSTKVGLSGQSDARENLNAAISPILQNHANLAAEWSCLSWSVEKVPPPGIRDCGQLSPPTAVRDWCVLGSQCDPDLQSAKTCFLEYNSAEKSQDVPKMDKGSEKWSCQYSPSRRLLDQQIKAGSCVLGCSVTPDYNQLRQLEACSNFNRGGLSADRIGKVLTTETHQDVDSGNGKLSRHLLAHSGRQDSLSLGLDVSSEGQSSVTVTTQHKRIPFEQARDFDPDYAGGQSLQARHSEHAKRVWYERSYCNFFNRGTPPDAHGNFQVLQHWTWIGSICSFVSNAKFHLCQCTYHHTFPEWQGVVSLLQEPCPPGRVCRNFSLWHTNEIRAYCLPEGFEPEWSSDFDTDPGPGAGSGSGSGSNSGSGSGSGSGSNTGAAPQSDVSCSRRVTYDDERPAKRPRPGPGSGAGPSTRPQSQLHLSLESHQASTHFRDNVEELWFEVAREGERAVKVGQAFKHSVTTYVHVMAATTLVRFCARISKHHGRVPTMQFLGGGIVNPPSLRKRSVEDGASGPEERLGRNVADRGKDAESTRSRHEKEPTMTSRSKSTSSLTDPALRTLYDPMTSPLLSSRSSPQRTTLTDHENSIQKRASGPFDLTDSLQKTPMAPSQASRPKRELPDQQLYYATHNEVLCHGLEPDSIPVSASSGLATSPLTGSQLTQPWVWRKSFCTERGWGMLVACQLNATLNNPQALGNVALLRLECPGSQKCNEVTSITNHIDATCVALSNTRGWANHRGEIKTCSKTPVIFRAPRPPTEDAPVTLILTLTSFLPFLKKRVRANVPKLFFEIKGPHEEKARIIGDAYRTSISTVSYEMEASSVEVIFCALLQPQNMAQYPCLVFLGAGYFLNDKRKGLDHVPPDATGMAPSLAASSSKLEKRGIKAGFGDIKLDDSDYYDACSRLNVQEFNLRTGELEYTRMHSWREAYCVNGLPRTIGIVCVIVQDVHAPDDAASLSVIVYKHCRDDEVCEAFPDEVTGLFNAACVPQKNTRRWYNRDKEDISCSEPLTLRSSFFKSHRAGSSMPVQLTASASQPGTRRKARVHQLYFELSLPGHLPINIGYSHGYSVSTFLYRMTTTLAVVKFCAIVRSGGHDSTFQNVAFSGAAFLGNFWDQKPSADITNIERLENASDKSAHATRSLDSFQCT